VWPSACAAKCFKSDEGWEVEKFFRARCKRATVGRFTTPIGMEPLSMSCFKTDKIQFLSWPNYGVSFVDKFFTKTMVVGLLMPSSTWWWSAAARQWWQRRQ
jgi:hypothetical protein